ncbi:MAG: beta-lactamase family protein [Chitinophagaceae bacterium]|nr:beta-lactamase family protein [Chitinophagaceae bacterium]
MLYKQGWLLLIMLACTAVAGGQHAAMQAAVDSAVAKGFSGVVLVAKNGKPVLKAVHGYRHFETKELLQFDDVFELASVSKQFTAMMMMMMAEEGKLRYDDTVGRYISLPYPGITIRHLLTHTSGLPDYQAVMDAHWDKQKIAGNDDCIHLLCKYAPPALFAPGEQYAYSNTGYLLLASIAEKASGEDFIDLMRRRIFKPLRMRHTDIRTLEAKAAMVNFAAGHMKDFLGEYVNANKFRSSDYTVWLGNRKGPGRISSTATDLLRWDRALYKQKLVSNATLSQAFSATKLSSGQLSDYGFGWDLEQHPQLGRIVKHNGDNPGYSTQIIRCIDKRYTIIVLCNNAHATFSTLVAALVAALAAA